MIGRVSPLFFGIIPLLLAIVQVYYNVGGLDIIAYQTSLKPGEIYTVDLTLKPGDRYFIQFETSGLSDVFVLEAEQYKNFKDGGKIPSSATTFQMLKKLGLAMPSNTGGDYKLVIKQLREGTVKINVKPGTVDEAVRKMRGGENVLRNSLEAELISEGVLVIPVYQFVKGTFLELDVTGSEKTLVLDSSEYIAFKRGAKSLEMLCVDDRCVRGAGSLRILSEEFGDVYIVVEVRQTPVSLRTSVIATPDMLLYTGTCG